MNTFSLILFLLSFLGVGITLYLCILGIIDTKYRPLLKNYVISFIVCFIVCSTSFVLFGTTLPEKTSNTPVANNQLPDTAIPMNNQTELAPESIQQKETSSSSSFNELEISEDTLSQLFSQIVTNEYSDLEVTADYDDASYTVQYIFTDTVWDESSLVTNCISDYINFCIKAYDMDNISSIRFAVFVPLIDSKGNESNNNVLLVRMNKDEFNTFNWSNLEYTKIYDVFVSSCEDFWLDKAIADYIDISDIIYRP